MWLLNICSSNLKSLGLQTGGGILWDFHISSVPIYVYDRAQPKIQKGLEYLCIVMLSLNAVIEIRGRMQLAIFINFDFPLTFFGVRYFDFNTAIRHSCVPDVCFKCFGLVPFLPNVFWLDPMVCSCRSDLKFLNVTSIQSSVLSR